MSLSGVPALDVVVGLAFLFFLLSTICSAISEAIATAMGWRAKTLEDAVRNMLGDADVKRGWQEWAGGVHRRLDATPGQDRDLSAEVFDHWRIAALTRNPDSGRRRRCRPSYLPPRAFSLAIAETLAAGPGRVPEGTESPWELTDDELLRRASAALAGMPDGPGRRFLTKAAVNAHGTLEGFRTQVELGFDDAMERASGWYKRKVTVVLAVIAVVITVGLNVSAVRIADHLWSDAALRQATAVAASHAGSATGAARAVDRVRELHLPAGWGAANGPSTARAVLGRIPGWLLTVVALSLGAPFWFDLLSRLARLRGSGVPERPRSLSDRPGTTPPT